MMPKAQYLFGGQIFADIDFILLRCLNIVSFVNSYVNDENKFQRSKVKDETLFR